jgi:hypothetical protein
VLFILFIGEFNMSFFTSWFRSTQADKEEVVEAVTLSNLKVGTFVEFDLISQEEVSSKSLKVAALSKLVLPTGKKYSFANLGNDIFLNKIDATNFELIKKLSDPSQFLDMVSEDFDGIMTIEDDEIQIENGREVLVSHETQLDILNGGMPNWMPEGTFYKIDDDLGCHHDGRECRFFRAKSLDNKNFIMIFTYDGGETDIYVSTVLADTYVRDVIGV